MTAGVVATNGVRVAVPSDVPGIEAAYLESWRAGYAGLLAPEELDEQMALRREHDWLGGIDADTSAVLVVTAIGAIAGVVQAVEAPGGVRDLPEITMLYVVPSWWGTSVARDLLTAASRWLRDRGHDVARLRVVERQARARRFYEGAGWEVDDGIEPASNNRFRLIYYRRDL